MATAIIGTLVFGTFASISYYTYKGYKNGGSCGGDCGNCSCGGNCHK